RLHSFRFRPTSSAWSSVRMVAGRRLLEWRHQPALSIRARAGLLARSERAQFDALGGGRRLRLRVRHAARAAALVRRAAARDQLLATANLLVRGCARLVAVERHGGGAVSRLVVARYRGLG